MRAAMTVALALTVAAFTVTMTACAPATPATPATPGSGGGGSGGAEPPATPTPTPEPTPAPPPPEPMKWTLDAEQFGDDGANIWIETSNRSQPFAWDAITADNLADVRVSIGGVALAGESRSFTSTLYEPAFEGDYSGAEWTISAEVSPGAVALVLTAPDQRIDRGDISHVIIEDGGTDYVYAAPTVTFGEPPAGGRRATGVVVGPGRIRRVEASIAGSGYTSPPTLEFFRTGLSPHDGGVQVVVELNAGSVGPIRVVNTGSGYWGGSWNCRFVPRLGGANCRVFLFKKVVAVELTDPGRGYRIAPSVTITKGTALGSGSGAMARAVLRGPRGNSQVENLFWGRQALYGKELLVEIVDE